VEIPGDYPGPLILALAGGPFRWTAASSHILT
jgi:hypothetical protein